MSKRFISDLHLGHTNINEKLDKRGFSTTDEMDEYIIEQWNSVTKKDDEVYVLGDFSFHDGRKTNEIIKRLNGKIHFIEGNHDKTFLRDRNFDRSLVKICKNIEKIKDNNRTIIASHYPQCFYDGQYRKDEKGNPTTYMLYGHIHNTQDEVAMNEIRKLMSNFRFTDRFGNLCSIPFNLINCFCMFSDYKPLTLEEWIENQANRT